MIAPVLTGAGLISVFTHSPPWSSVMNQNYHPAWSAAAAPLFFAWAGEDLSGAMSIRFSLLAALLQARWHGFVQEYISTHRWSTRG
jgi:hypothetical protein